MDKLAKYDKEVNIDLSLSQLGEVFAKSGFFQNCRDANQAIVKILAGQENGFGPFTSMKDIHLIPKKGGGVQVEIGAHLHAAAIRSSALYDFKVIKLTNEECQLEFVGINKVTGKWESLGISSFTQKDAALAQLDKPSQSGHPSNYKKFPRNMLFARAMTNGVEWYCPDVFQSRMYGPGEISGEISQEQKEKEWYDNTAEYGKKIAEESETEESNNIIETPQKHEIPYEPDLALRKAVKEENNNHTSQEYQDLDKDCAFLIWLMKRADQADIDNAQFQVEIQWYEKQEHTLKGLQKALPSLTEKVEAEGFRFVIPPPEEVDEWVKQMKEVFNVSEDNRLYFDHFRADGNWEDLCHLYFDAQWEYEHQEEQK
jgi:hypothetical protein